MVTIVGANAVQPSIDIAKPSMEMPEAVAKVASSVTPTPTPARRKLPSFQLPPISRPELDHPS